MTAAGLRGAPPSLAVDVRAEIIRRGGIGSVVAFWWLLIACSVAMLAVVLYAASWYPAARTLQFEFGTEVLQGDPSEYAPWLARQIERWPGLVAASPAEPALVGAIAVVALVLLGFGYGAFRRPAGRSLLGLDSTRAGAEAVLRRLGHFTDIRMSTHSEGFHASRRVLFAPYHYLRNLSAAVSTGEVDPGLRFFAAHEYVHQVTRDNLVHWLARLVLLAFGPMAILYLFMMVLFAAMLAVPWVGLSAYVVCVALALYSVVFAILASVQLAVVGHMKAREFFADRVAAAMVPDFPRPYGAPDGGEPAFTSGWERRVTIFERSLHEVGQSLHARNLLPGGLVLHALTRTLFLLFCPPEASLAVLVLDAACAGALLYLAWVLPPRPPRAGLAAVVPWVVCLAALLGLWLSTVGLAGAVQLMGVELVSTQWGLLVSWPLIASWLVALFAASWSALAQRRPPGGKGLGGAVLVAALALATIPGSLASIMLFLVLLLLSGASIHGLSTVVSEPGAGIVAVALSLLLALLSLSGLGLLFRGWIRPSLAMLCTELGIAFCILMTLGLMTAVFLQPVLQGGRSAASPAELGPVLAQSDGGAYADAAGLCILLWFLYAVAKVVEVRCRRALAGLRPSASEG